MPIGRGWSTTRVLSLTTANAVSFLGQGQWSNGSANSCRERTVIDDPKRRNVTIGKNWESNSFRIQSHINAQAVSLSDCISGNRVTFCVSYSTTTPVFMKHLLHLSLYCKDERDLQITSLRQLNLQAITIIKSSIAADQSLSNYTSTQASRIRWMEVSKTRVHPKQWVTLSNHVYWPVAVGLLLISQLF